MASGQPLITASGLPLEIDGGLASAGAPLAAGSQEGHRAQEPPAVRDKRFRARPATSGGRRAAKKLTLAVMFLRPACPGATLRCRRGHGWGGAPGMMSA